MVATTPLAEARTVLQNISWQTFKAMLIEMDCDRISRIAYDSGLLEIMTRTSSASEPDRTPHSDKSACSTLYPARSSDNDNNSCNVIESSTISTVGSIGAPVDSVPLPAASKNGTGLASAVCPWNISIISNTSEEGIILPSPNTVASATQSLFWHRTLELFNQ